MKELKDYPDILFVEDIKVILRIGKDTAYNLVNSNDFHTVHVGERILTYKKVFEEWLQGKENKEIRRN